MHANRVQSAVLASRPDTRCGGAGSERCGLLGKREMRELYKPGPLFLVPGKKSEQNFKRVRPHEKATKNKPPQSLFVTWKDRPDKIKNKRRIPENRCSNVYSRRRTESGVSPLEKLTNADEKVFRLGFLRLSSISGKHNGRRGGPDQTTGKSIPAKRPDVAGGWVKLRVLSG